MGTVHENVVLKFVALQEMDKGLSVLELGKILVEKYGVDTLVDGGIWILDIPSQVEFYSPLFRSNLGYENELDFPSVSASWQKAIEPRFMQKAYNDYLKHIESKGDVPYYLEVTYNKKMGGKLDLLCSGTAIFKNGKPSIMVGTHKIKK